MPVLYLAFLGVLALERGAELWLSRRNARLAEARGAVEVGRDHFAVMRVFHGAFLAACALEVVCLDRRAPGAWALVFLAGALGAQALRYWAVATLGERWNVRILVIPGAPPVTEGPYRYLRHPNYLAVIVEMACVPLAGGAYLTALVFSIGNAALLAVRIRAEEKALGEMYSRTFAERPRFWPAPPGGGGGTP